MGRTPGVLVTMEVDAWGWGEEPDEVVARLPRDAPEIRALIGAHQQIVDAELPWWGDSRPQPST